MAKMYATPDNCPYLISAKWPESSFRESRRLENEFYRLSQNTIYADFISLALNLHEVVDEPDVHSLGLWIICELSQSLETILNTYREH